MPTEAKVALHRRARRRRAPRDRSGRFVRRSGSRSSPTPPRSRALAKRAGRRLPGARPEPDRARARARSRREVDRDLHRGVRDVQQAQHQHDDRRVVRGVHAGGARARERGHPRARLRVDCAFGCPYEGDVRRRRCSRSPRALLDLGCYEVSLGDTIGVGTPLQVAGRARRCSRRSSRANGSRCTSTTRAARRSRTRWPRWSSASPPSTPRPAGSAAAPTRRARRATSRPRISSTCSTAMGIEHGVDLDKLVAAARVIAPYLDHPLPGSPAGVHERPLRNSPRPPRSRIFERGERARALARNGPAHRPLAGHLADLDAAGHVNICGLPDALLMGRTPVPAWRRTGEANPGSIGFICRAS